MCLSKYQHFGSIRSSISAHFAWILDWKLCSAFPCIQIELTADQEQICQIAFSAANLAPSLLLDSFLLRRLQAELYFYPQVQVTFAQ